MISALFTFLFITGYVLSAPTAKFPHGVGAAGRFVDSAPQAAPSLISRDATAVEASTPQRVHHRNTVSNVGNAFNSSSNAFNTSSNAFAGFPKIKARDSNALNTSSNAFAGFPYDRRGPNDGDAQGVGSDEKLVVARSFRDLASSATTTEERIVARALDNLEARKS